MVRRAAKVRRDATSSFPSRAVTCAVVYAFAVCYLLQEYWLGWGFAWWMPLLFVGSALLASLARVSLGVHYPSDCLLGVVQGGVIVALSLGAFHVDAIGCESCATGKCYSTAGATALRWATLWGRLNYLMLGLALGITALIAVAAIVRPLEFWVKADRIYGMLFPCLVFQLVFLCPKSNGASLPQPTFPPPWFAFVFAGSTAILLTVR